MRVKRREDGNERRVQGLPDKRKEKNKKKNQKQKEFEIKLEQFTEVLKQTSTI